MNNDEHNSINLEELKQISSDPLVSFEAHSLTHRNLRLISAEEARHEIFDSKTNLEKFLHKPILYFAYPEGSFNEAIAQMVQEAGYRLAFRASTSRFVYLYPPTFYSVRRIKVHSKDNLFVFWLHVSGITNVTKKISLVFRQLTSPKTDDTLNVHKPANATM